MPYIVVTPKKGIPIVVKYDYKDYQLIHSRTWYKCGKYIADGNLKYLHRLILGVTDRKIMVDHRNGNTHDFTRANLRICNRSQNGANRIKKCKSGSRYIGVSFHKYSQKWRAVLRKDGRQNHIGYFDNELQAATAYDTAAKKIHGAFAHPNF